jgi:Lrp/AsnC family leucine-responsive transcriptional regulator
MKIDATDRKLLMLLQDNSKQTSKQLASKLNLSVTAVYERIRKLEREGVITGYTASINKAAVGKGFVVFCHLKLIQHTREFVTQFEKEVLQLNEVQECYHISGDYDYLLKINVENMDEYRQFLVTKLTTLEHIGSTHSTFMISEVRHTTVLSL